MKWTVAICLLLGVVSPASALEVTDVTWGFDGKVVPGRINLLTVRVVNPSASPYEGALVLYKRGTAGQELGAKLAQGCFVSPYASRWVQFYPYVIEDKETWLVAWGGRRTERAELTRARLGPPARVLLDDSDDPFEPSAELKAFPDNLFPTTVAATDGLYSVVLDHVPRWEPVKREAFMDWLRRGGTVHLLHAGDGAYPVFPADLADLNAPLERFRVGAGLVVRHPVGRGHMGERLLEGKGFSQPVLERTRQPVIHKLEDSLFESQKGMTQPEHDWVVIYLMILAYVVIVGPVNYLLGRKWQDYRLTALFFLIMVLAFAYGFKVVGRRGYGEAAAIHTISYARPLGDDVFDVTQWSNAFATSSGRYTVTHDAPHNLYSTCQDMEAVDGVIQNGKDGRFDVSIPLYSSRAFLHRAKMKGHSIVVEVVEHKAADRLEALTLAPGAGFPPRTAGIWVLHEGRFYRMALKEDRIQKVAGTGWKAEDFLSRRAFDKALFRGQDYYGRVRDVDNPKAASQRMARLLIARSLGGTDAFLYRVRSGPLPGDWLQLFILAPSPTGFYAKEGRLGQERGYVLYHVSVAKPEN